MLIAVLALVVLGVAFIHSATVRMRPDGTSYGRGFWLLQVKWLGVALIAFSVMAAIDYMKFARNAYLIYGAGIAGLILVLFLGHVVGGSRRWLVVCGYRVQPSEVMKVAMIVVIARYLMYRRNYRTLGGLAVPLALLLVPMALIIRQPDLGTAVAMLPILFVMLYAAGARVRDLGAVVGAGMACIPVLWFSVMSATQKGRIVAFLNPKADPLGRGYHVIQSLIAISSGGPTGKGFARGDQNMLNLVPARHTDFIFAVIAEEWGLVGAMLVLVLFLFIFLRAADIAARTREPFGRLVVVGGLTLLAFQVIVNVGMTMRLCPITGLTLPFVSYGGSSLVVSFMVLGLIINVGMRPKPVAAPEDFG